MAIWAAEEDYEPLKFYILMHEVVLRGQVSSQEIVTSVSIIIGKLES